MHLHVFVLPRYFTFQCNFLSADKCGPFLVLGFLYAHIVYFKTEMHLLGKINKLSIRDSALKKKKSFQILYFCPLDQTSLHSVPIILISATKRLLILRFFTYHFSSIASDLCSCLKIQVFQKPWKVISRPVVRYSKVLLFPMLPFHRAFLSMDILNLFCFCFLLLSSNILSTLAFLFAVIYCNLVSLDKNCRFFFTNCCTSKYMGK